VIVNDEKVNRDEIIGVTARVRNGDLYHAATTKTRLESHSMRVKR
jgi:hypothetical protein